MSRALYHLSYGTAQAGRHAERPEEGDPILRSAPAPLACASSSAAWPAPLAFSCSSSLQKMMRSRNAAGSVIGSRFVKARFAFASTLYSLADRQLPVPGEGRLSGRQGDQPGADLVVERVFDAILLHRRVRTAPRLRP